jgi:hypothetical protein
MKENKQNIRKEFEIPKHVMEFCENTMGFKPSVIKTEYYTYDSLKEILDKHNLVWSIKTFNDYTIYNEGIVNISNNDILFYFVKRSDEMSYKYFCLSKEESTDSVLFYLNQFKKYKTIS